MAVNKAAADAKVGSRQRDSNVERAKRIAAKNPDGRIARRLNALGDGTLGYSMAPTGAVTSTGRLESYGTPGQSVADSRPNVNVAHVWATRRMPGSPF